MSLLEATIGWLAPPRCIGCGAENLALCAACSTSEIVAYGERCGYCGRLSARAQTCEHCRRLGTPRFVWISTNYQATAQRLVQIYKFGHLRAASRPIATSMAQTLKNFNSPDTLNAANYLVVPLPTATSRVRQRGFDHSCLLAKTVAREFGLEYYAGLSRLGQTRQVGASRQARLAQQTNDYFVRQARRIKGRNILLIDDVVTTGGSLIAATKCLRTAGANHIDALVFAKRL